MPLYFAYGSCMNRNSLAQTVGRFSVIGPARLNGYRLRFDRRAGAPKTYRNQLKKKLHI